MYRRTEADAPGLSPARDARLEEALRQAREAMTACGVMPRPELWQETERWARAAAGTLVVPAWMAWARYREMLDALVLETLKGR